MADGGCVITANLNILLWKVRKGMNVIGKNGKDESNRFKFPAKKVRDSTPLIQNTTSSVLKLQE